MLAGRPIDHDAEATFSGRHPVGPPPSPGAATGQRNGSPGRIDFAESRFLSRSIGYAPFLPIPTFTTDLFEPGRLTGAPGPPAVLCEELLSC